MVGNGVVCAIRVGDWDWGTALLEEWIPDDTDARQFSELFVDRAILTALRGGDPSADIEHATALRAEITDPQYESYDAWARAWASFSAGRFAAARKEALRAAEITSYFHPLGVPLAARASLWAHDMDGARGAMDVLGRTMYRGQGLALDKAAISAGILALEGRATDALALYRETLRGWRGLNLAWDEALTCVDMVAFLGPAEPEVRAAAEAALVTLSRLGAQPYLDRLDAALSGSTSPAAHPLPRARIPAKAASPH